MPSILYRHEVCSFWLTVLHHLHPHTKKKEGVPRGKTNSRITIFEDSIQVDIDYMIRERYRECIILIKKDKTNY